mmetsp:Transcript_597/g.1057  ORF Transcript_597/g.1057 Transcript_597/m.1057 type:complete len:257 (+) Transcript_597:101-871(+)
MHEKRIASHGRGRSRGHVTTQNGTRIPQRQMKPSFRRRHFPRSRRRRRRPSSATIRIVLPGRFRRVPSAFRVLFYFFAGILLGLVVLLLFLSAIVVVVVVCAVQRNAAVANRRRANRPRDGMPGIRRHDLRSRLPPPSLLSLRRAPPHRQEDSTPARSRRHASLSPLFERTGRDPPTLRGGEFAKGHVDEGDQIERSAGEEVRQRGEGGLRGRWDVCHLRGGDRAGRGIVVVVVVESHEGHGEADFEGEARVEDGV